MSPAAHPMTGTSRVNQTMREEVRGTKAEAR